MSAIQIEPPSTDPVVARLDQVLAELAAVVADCTPVADADRIDGIARLEKLRSVTAALQAAESVRFAQSQVAEQLAADVHPERIGRGMPNRSGWRAVSPPLLQHAGSVQGQSERRSGAGLRSAAGWPGPRDHNDQSGR
jgi:hypothetical protein